MDTIISLLEFSWKVITSEQMSNAAFFFYVLATSIVFYFGAVAFLNTYRMRVRKEKSMEEVETVVEAIHQQMNSHFYTLAKDHLGVDFFTMMETQFVKKIYYESLMSCKNEMRRRVRKNGFDEKKPQEWLDYVRHAIDEDMISVTHALDDLWPSSAVIKRDTAYTHNSVLDQIIAEKLRAMYDTLLNIANQHRIVKFMFKWTPII